MANVIDISALHKSFGSTHALDGLDLQVAPGEVHGFLGPNGAGKSTTIRVLLGLLRADAGAVRLFDADPWREAAALHRRLAYVPGDVTLWPNLSGGEVIDLLGRLRGGLDEPRRADLIDRFELDPTKKGRSYSKGNRQKVALVAALASDVDLLVLDEPTSGLDPLMEAVFTACVEEFKSAGGTVLLSSHILAEVERLCDRVSIIRNGRNVESGTLADLRHLTRTSIRAELAQAPSGLEALPGLHDLVIEGQRVSFEVDTDRLDEAMRALSPLGIRSLVCQPPTLEELFLRHYGDEVRESADDRRRHAAGRLRAAGPVDGPVVHPRGHPPLLVPGGERRRPLHDPGRVRPSRSEHGGQRRVHRDDRAGPGAEHHRGPGHLAGGGVRVDPGGTHDDVPRRPAHPGRGGVGPRRAAPVRRGRSPGPDDRRTGPGNRRQRRGRRGGDRQPGAYGLPTAGAVALGLGLWLCGVTFGSIALRRRPAHLFARGPCTASPAQRSGSPTACARSATSATARSRWLSPIGWYQAMHAFSGERWWPALLLLAAAGLAGHGAAYAVFARRDVGSGIWPARPGPDRAPIGLRGSFGLAWRLQRGAVIGWAGVSSSAGSPTARSATT